MAIRSAFGFFKSSLKAIRTFFTGEAQGTQAVHKHCCRTFDTKRFTDSDKINLGKFAYGVLILG
jgi:hypothetical protein